MSITIPKTVRHVTEEFRLALIRRAQARCVALLWDAFPTSGDRGILNILRPGGWEANAASSPAAGIWGVACQRGAPSTLVPHAGGQVSNQFFTNDGQGCSRSRPS